MNMCSKCRTQSISRFLADVMFFFKRCGCIITIGISISNFILTKNILNIFPFVRGGEVSHWFDSKSGLENVHFISNSVTVLYLKYFSSKMGYIFFSIRV